MNVKEWALKLTGRQIDKEMTGPEEDEAKADGIVVVFGASDDLAEIRGALFDEIGCYEGGEIFLTKEGFFEECECGCKYSQAAQKQARKITALWAPDDGTGTSWTSWAYKTDIPHETFDIMDGDELYCRGIIFELAAL